MDANPHTSSGILGLMPSRKQGARGGAVGPLARWLRRWHRTVDPYLAPRYGRPDGEGGPEGPDDRRLTTESLFDDPAFWMWMMH